MTHPFVFISDTDLPLKYMNGAYLGIYFSFETTRFFVTKENYVYRLSSDSRNIKYQKITSYDYMWFLTALEYLALELNVPEMEFEEKSRESFILSLLTRRVSYNPSELKVLEITASLTETVSSNQNLLCQLRKENFKETMLRFITNDPSFISSFSKMFGYTTRFSRKNLKSLLGRELRVLISSTPTFRLTTPRVKRENVTIFGTVDHQNRTNLAISTVENHPSMFWLFFLLLPTFLLAILIYKWRSRPKPTYRKKKKNNNKELSPLLVTLVDWHEFPSFSQIQQRHVGQIVALLKAVEQIWSMSKLSKYRGFERTYVDPLRNVYTNLDPNNKQALEEKKECLRRLCLRIQTNDKSDDCAVLKKFTNIILYATMDNLALLTLEISGNAAPRGHYFPYEEIMTLRNSLDTVQQACFNFCNQYMFSKLDRIGLDIPFLGICRLVFSSELAAHAYGYYLLIEPERVNSSINLQDRQGGGTSSTRTGLLVILKMCFDQCNAAFSSTGKRKEKNPPAAIEQKNNLMELSNFVRNSLIAQNNRLTLINQRFEFRNRDAHFFSPPLPNDEIATATVSSSAATQQESEAELGRLQVTAL